MSLHVRCIPPHGIAGPLRLLALAIVAGGLGTLPADADIIFSDGFSYADGSLAGNNGGFGWSGAWSGGTSQVTDPLPGTTGKAVQISADASVSTRLLSAPTTTGTTSYYVSFLFNANPFQSSISGDYAGISLMGSGSGSLFMGMPGGSGQLGFDWSVAGVGTEGGLYAADSNTNYLTLFEIKQGPSANTTVSMYATTNLLMSGSALIASGARATVDNGNFSFDTVEISGGYATGSIDIAGLAMATTADEAVAFTQIAVPEPSSLALGGVAAVVRGIGVWRRRRTAGGTSCPWRTSTAAGGG